MVAAGVPAGVASLLPGQFTGSAGARLATAAPAMAASATMRVLVQRVSSARVAVDGEVVGAVRQDGQRLLVLGAATQTDDIDRAQRLAEKLWQRRILDDERCAADFCAPILVVSQFTLYANTAKSRRPSWSAAAPAPVAQPLVTAFVGALRRLGAHVETGVFGAHRQGRTHQRPPGDGAAAGAVTSRPNRAHQPLSREGFAEVRWA
jgi:D-aminoacyl-tRNA deacylase